jgi:hypothetical protein
MFKLEISQENINCVAQSLAILTTQPPPLNLQALKALRELYAPEMLKASATTLNNDQKRIVKNLTIELNNQTLSPRSP